MGGLLMPSDYTHRCFILIPALRLSAANAAMEQAGYGRDNFFFGLGLLPQGPATFYVCDIALTDAQVTEIQQLIPSAIMLDLGDLDSPERLFRMLQQRGLVRVRPDARHHPFAGR